MLMSMLLRSLGSTDHGRLSAAAWCSPSWNRPATPVDPRWLCSLHLQLVEDMYYLLVPLGGPGKYTRLGYLLRGGRATLPHQEARSRRRDRPVRELSWTQNLALGDWWGQGLVSTFSIPGSTPLALSSADRIVHGRCLKCSFARSLPGYALPQIG